MMTSNKTSGSDVAMDEAIDENMGAVFLSETGEVNNVKDNERATDKSGNDEANKEGSSDVNNAVNTFNSRYKPMPIKKKNRRGSRRNKRRKYKPYSELTWEEKKAVEERDSRRAVSIRQKYMHEKGRPLAPFNTSQFLMAEHDTKEPDLHVSHHHHHEPYTLLSSSAEDTDYGDSSLSDEEQDIEVARNFLQKDFTETYDRLHSESLHRMNKDQLINEYMRLEDKVENLEKELTVIKSNGVRVDTNSNGSYQADVAAPLLNNTHTGYHNDETTRIKLELEVEKLREENRQLHLENNILRPKVNHKEDASDSV